MNFTRIKSLLLHRRTIPFGTVPQSVNYSFDLSHSINNPGDITFFIPAIIAANEQGKLKSVTDRYNIVNQFLIHQKPELHLPAITITRTKRSFMQKSDSASYFVNFGSNFSGGIAYWIYSHFNFDTSFEDCLRVARRNIFQNIKEDKLKTDVQRAVEEPYIVINLETFSGKSFLNMSYPRRHFQVSWLTYVDKIMSKSNSRIILTGTSQTSNFSAHGKNVVDLRGKTSIQDICFILNHHNLLMSITRDNFCHHISSLLGKRNNVMIPRSFRNKSEYNWIKERYFDVFS